MEESVKCALCKQNKPLCTSHIISSFFYKHMKNKSKTKKIIDSSNPKQRLQDGFKRKLLCNDCEDIFGRLEKEFSKTYLQIFNMSKIQAIELPIATYGLIISLAWRIIISTMGSQYPNNFTKNDLEEISKHKKIMEDYLHKNVDINYEIHCVPLMRPFIEDTCMLNYSEWSISHDVRCFDDKIVVFVKVPKLLFCLYLKNENKDNDLWQGTRLTKCASNVWSETIRIPEFVFVFMRNAIQHAYDNVTSAIYEKAQKRLNKCD
ncbi:hypothetical protein ADMFC3_16590 [Geovibrio sp. ADMFC3]